MKGSGLRVVVAGGGVAGLETLLALRALAGDRVRLHLISPGDEFVYRPLEVLEPFDQHAMVRIPWARIVDDLGVSHLSAVFTDIDFDQRRAQTATADSVPFDALVIASGGDARPTVPRAITIGTPGAPDLLRQVVERLRARAIRRLVFVVPPGVTWTLPIYELALLTARLARSVEADVDLEIVTAESQPLEVFGVEAGVMVRELLNASSVQLRVDGLMERSAGMHTCLELPPRPPTDAVIALPRLLGPRVTGLRSDDDGFLLVDHHGLAKGEEDVYAAGDATSFPVKQGGLAAQQAEAVAAHIARRAGAEVEEKPFEPVLRGMLLTGGAPRYLRLALTAAACETELSEESPWWPPVKIVGRHLAPYLAAHASWAAR
ncbi:MAG TPA: FAD-dependent oxidoreductase [Solirubrobacteraceae bacterium]|nr:FAD-dependent oxidoreductase [Solirubrobacteraceae bacterium]